MKSKKMKVTMNSPVILCFAFLCFAATLLCVLSGGRLRTLLFSTYHSALLSPLTWLRAFTHVLGHGDWAHLAGNMGYILLLGPLLEEKYSSKTLIKVIMLTAFITSLVNYILFPGVALCGASGVVFAFILLSSFTDFKDGEIPLTFILVAVFFLGQQVYDGLFVKDNVSNLTHIIGGVIGAVLGYMWNRKK